MASRLGGGNRSEVSYRFPFAYRGTGGYRARMEFELARKGALA
jgi:hypothetical protein